MFLICIRKKGGICKKCCFTVKGKYLVEYSYYNYKDKETIKKQKTTLDVSNSTYSSVSLGWKEMQDVDGYQVYYSTKKDSGFKKYATYDSEVTSATVKGLTTGKTYYFKVRGMKVENNANVYTKFSDVVSKKLKLNAPKNLYVARDTYNSLKVTWEKSSGATYYELYRREGDKGSWKKIKTYKKDVKEAKVTSLKTGTYYYFKLRAKRYSGDDAVYSSYSNIDYAKPQLNKPTITVTKKSSSSVNVSWKSISGANGYQLYQATGSGAYKRTKTVNSKTKSITVKSPKKGNTYGYKERANLVVNKQNVYSSFSKIVKKKM